MELPVHLQYIQTTIVASYSSSIVTIQYTYIDRHQWYMELPVHLQYIQTTIVASYSSSLFTTRVSGFSVCCCLRVAAQSANFRVCDVHVHEPAASL